MIEAALDKTLKIRPTGISRIGNLLVKILDAQLRFSAQLGLSIAKLKLPCSLH